MRVLIQLRPSPDVVAAVADPTVTMTTADVSSPLPGVVLDPSFTPVAVPRPVPGAGGDPLSLHQPLTFSFAGDQATILVRGEISDDELSTRLTLLPTRRREVVGVFADPVIEPILTCGGDAPVGDWRDVERLLHVAELASEGMNGSGVALAVLDTGINVAHVAEHLGRDVILDSGRSWNPGGVSGTAGKFKVDHGTMCAFDTLIAAPRATLIDIPVLLSERPGGSALDGLLSDAVAALAHLRTVLEEQPLESRSLVISNSWGSFSPRWDFPVGHTGNYSDSLAHPFNLIVSSLDQAGADVLFAAGNCGRDCKDGRCAYPERPSGAPTPTPASCPSAAWTRTASESATPPRAPAVSPPTSRTSAPTPTSPARRPSATASPTRAPPPPARSPPASSPPSAPCGLPPRLSPAQLRTLLRRTADDRSDVGFDYDYGYGIADPLGMIDSLRRAARA